DHATARAATGGTRHWPRAWAILNSDEAVRITRLSPTTAGVAMSISPSEVLCRSRYCGPASITYVSPSSLAAKIGLDLSSAREDVATSPRSSRVGFGLEPQQAVDLHHHGAVQDVRRDRRGAL